MAGGVDVLLTGPQDDNDNNNDDNNNDDNNDNTNYMMRLVRFWSWSAPGEPLTPLQVISLELPPPASGKDK